MCSSPFLWDQPQSWECIKIDVRWTTSLFTRGEFIYPASKVVAKWNLKRKSKNKVSRNAYKLLHFLTNNSLSMHKPLIQLWYSNPWCDYILVCFENRLSSFWLLSAPPYLHFQRLSFNSCKASSMNDCLHHWYKWPHVYLYKLT